jgi:hypothetical protein
MVCCHVMTRRITALLVMGWKGGCSAGVGDAVRNERYDGGCVCRYRYTLSEKRIQQSV